MPIPRTKRTPTCTAGLSRLEVLLCLIVIGVLASLLLPRLAELNEAARPARLQAAMAQARAGANVFHARCEAARQSSAEEACALLLLDGVAVAGANGWPAATADGLPRAAGLSLADAKSPGGWRWRTGQRHGVPALFIGLKDPGCEFSYVQATGPDSFPEVDIVDASCH